MPEWHSRRPRFSAADFGAGEGQDSKNFWALALGSAGVVFGDIGTSPLYAFKEAITAATQRGLTAAEATLGVLSLIFWSMTLVVTMKYVLLLLRADNKGEGGMFALMALGQTVAKRSAPLLGALGIAGASFFYGDAVITPAISVSIGGRGPQARGAAIRRSRYSGGDRHSDDPVLDAGARHGSGRKIFRTGHVRLVCRARPRRADAYLGQFSRAEGVESGCTASCSSTTTA